MGPNGGRRNIRATRQLPTARKQADSQICLIRESACYVCNWLHSGSDPGLDQAPGVVGWVVKIGSTGLTMVVSAPHGETAPKLFGSPL